MVCIIVLHVLDHINVTNVCISIKVQVTDIPAIRRATLYTVEQYGLYHSPRPYKCDECLYINKDTIYRHSVQLYVEQHCVQLNNLFCIIVLDHINVMKVRITIRVVIIDFIGHSWWLMQRGSPTHLVRTPNVCLGEL